MRTALHRTIIYFEIESVLAHYWPTASEAL